MQGKLLNKCYLLVCSGFSSLFLSSTVFKIMTASGFIIFIISIFINRHILNASHAAQQHKVIVSATVCSLSFDRQVLWVPLYFLLPDQRLLGQLPFVKNVRIKENFQTLKVKVCQLSYIENDAEFIHLSLIFDPQASVLNCPFRGFKAVQRLPATR